MILFYFLRWLTMKFALHFHATRSYWRDGAPSAEWQSRIFEWTRRTGFDGIDISDSWDLRSLRVSELRDVKRRVENAGLELATLSCMGKTLHVPELAEANLAAILSSLDIAAELGVGLVNLSLSTPRQPGVVPVFGVPRTPGGSRVASDRDFDVTIDRLRQVCDRASNIGIQLSVELHDRSLADTPSSLIRILDGVARPNIGANPDLTNGYRAYDVPDDTWQQTIERLAPLTNLWHINNLQRVHFPDVERAAFVEAPLATGDVDYRWALQVVQDAGFDGWVVIENKSSTDTFELSRLGLDYMRNLLAARL